MQLLECSENIIDTVLTAATTVHRELGPGLLESVYEKALLVELVEQGVEVQSQVSVPVIYKGKDLGIGFKADLIIEGQLVIELKAVDKLNDLHTAQLMNYLKLLNIKRGFIFNFNQRLLKHGIKRVSI